MSANKTVGDTNVTVTAPNSLVSNVQAIRSGEMPQNAQLQQTVENTKQALDEAKYEGNLSAKGQTLVDDAKAVLDSASRMISEKNHDQKLQRIIGNSVAASKETRTGLSTSDVTGVVGRDDLAAARGEAKEIYMAAREVVVFAVKSGQFRDMLMEVLDLLQTILRSTQDKLANQSEVKPGELANQMKGETFFTEEYRNSLWTKFRTMINRMGQHPEYYNAVDHLFAIVDQMNEKATQLKTQVQTTTTTQAVVPKSRFEQIWADAKALLEEFSGNGSVDMFTSRAWNLHLALREDQEARALLWEWRVFLKEAVRNPTALDDQTRSGTGRQLIDRTRWLLQGKHRSEFDSVFEAGKLILTNISNDSSRQDFSSKLQKLVSDFAYDESGRPDLYVLQESLGQIRQILVPVITKQLANLPIPRIEGSNPKYDFAIDGLLLNVTDLLPDFINLRTKTDSRMNVQRLKAQKNSTKVVLEVDQVKAFFKDIKFMYRRKKMPRIEDHGVADVDVAQGTGISLKMVWKVKSVGNQPLQLRLVRVKCNIARLVITIKDAKHKIVDKLVTKLFAGTIKRQMANAIVNNIIKAVTPLGAKLNEMIRNRPHVGNVMERANEGMKTSLFSGPSGEQSALSKAAHQLQTGVNQAKDKVTTMAHNAKEQHQQSQLNSTSSYNTVNTGFADTTPLTVTEPVPLTFVEKERVATKQWNFEWYSPSTYDANTQSFQNFESTDGISIPVTQEDTYSSVPVNQMSNLNFEKYGVAPVVNNSTFPQQSTFNSK